MTVTGLPLVDALIWLVFAMGGVWVISLARRDASIVDIVWGLAFLLAAWVYLFAVPRPGVRPIVVVALVHVWGLRLSLYLLWRNWGTPEDRRYRAMRETHGRRFWWVSLLTVFGLQAVLAWIISFPLYATIVGGPAALSLSDAVGMSLFVIGFGFETIGDLQLARFKADPRHRGVVCDVGLWRYTRHPNYFGEAVLWWGLAWFALSTADAWWVLVGPLLLTYLLLRVSGVSLLEGDLTTRKPGYQDYVDRTSAFIPWPPRPRSARLTS